MPRYAEGWLGTGLRLAPTLIQAARTGLTRPPFPTSKGARVRPDATRRHSFTQSLQEVLGRNRKPKTPGSIKAGSGIGGSIIGPPCVAAVEWRIGRGKKLFPERPELGKIKETGSRGRRSDLKPERSGVMSSPREAGPVAMGSEGRSRSATANHPMISETFPGHLPYKPHEVTVDGGVSPQGRNLEAGLEEHRRLLPGTPPGAKRKLT